MSEVQCLRGLSLTADRLRAVLKYDEATGIFTRVKQVHHKSAYLKNGQPGYIKCGYRVIRVDRHQYLAHRLAWLYVTGSWPDGSIDHKDGDGDNNAWCNIRLCTHSQNMANRKVLPTSRIGLKGVREIKPGKFVARIRSKGNVIWYKTFPSAELAHEAYLAKAREIHGEYAWSPT